jgi:hypothetical protein
MARNIIEFDSYNADVVSYNSYDPTKTVLGPDIYQFTGTTPYDYYIGPNTTAYRDITQDTGVSNWGSIEVIPYTGDTQWVFVLRGNSTTIATMGIAAYEFNKSNYTYTFKGTSTLTNVDATARTWYNLSADLRYYTAGTVNVSGTTVNGIGTDWINNRIPVGARIGFGSTDRNQISTWYRISNYPNVVAKSGFTGGVPTCVVLDSLGNTYVAGAFTSYSGVSSNRIIKLTSGGTIDTTFNIGSGFNATVNCITIDSEGKLYVGGSFTTYNGVTNNRIIKLNTNGTKDSSFDNSTGFTSGNVNVIKIDSLGDLYVGGSFSLYKGVTNNNIVKLTTGGTINTTFNTVFSAGTGFNGAVNDIVVDNSNNIYVGGTFTSYKGSATNVTRIAKLDLSGNTSPSFVVGAGFNGTVQCLHYNPSNDSIIVGGFFSSYKSVSNVYLTILSSLGDAIVSSKSVDQINSFYYSNNKLYTYTNANKIVKYNTTDTNLVIDGDFNPNIILSTVSTLSNLGLTYNPSNDSLYIISNDLTRDVGLVKVDGTYGDYDLSYTTTPDYSAQRITINASASTLSGSSYVIEDLRLFAPKENLSIFMAQGISWDDFTIAGTAISSPSSDFLGLQKGAYSLRDFGYTNTSSFNNSFYGGNVTPSCRVYTHNSEKRLYFLGGSGRLLKLNYLAPNIYATPAGAGIQTYYTNNQLYVSSISSPALSQFTSGVIDIGTLQNGTASGVTSLFTNSNQGYVQYPLDDNTTMFQTPITYFMSEVPPGSTTTYPTVGNVSRIYHMPEIDRLISLNISSTAKSYILRFNTNLQQPTLTNTLYSRDTYNELAYNNSFDMSFLVNGQQLQGSTANINSPKYPDTLGTGFYGSTCDGVLHLSRPLSTIQNNLYAVPLNCEAKYVDTTNNVFITPKYTLPNVIAINGLFINQLKEYGSGVFSIPPEVIVIHYRTSGIDDNSGEWTEFTNVKDLNDNIICDGVLETITIQFRFSYKIAGNTCIPNRIYSFALSYEDDRTDSHYSPSVSKTNLNSRIFAWRQESLWNSNIPNLKIRLYNTSNNNIVFYDTVTNSNSGTWEYSTDGINWNPWSSSADAIGNYIRYIADFIPSGIKLKVCLNQI